jgi:hypothetical protein
MTGIAFYAILAMSMAQPQTPVTPPAVGTVKAFACSFPLFAAVAWTSPPQVVSQSQQLTFRFDSIDLKKRSARLVGTGGTTLVSVLATAVGVTLIEQTPLGNVNMTTIFATGQQDRTFLAVHSRHIGDRTSPPAVSQNYGTCEAS